MALVVEHEREVADLERLYLSRAGFDVEIETDPERAVALARRLRPAVVVFDLSAPGLARSDIHRRVAAAAAPAPVVFLVSGTEPARSGERFLVRPFSPRELVGAVRAAIRRESEPARQAGIMCVGAVIVDPGTRTVSVDGNPAGLTGTEFDLLAFLMSHPGRVYAREQLLAAVWGDAETSGARTVDVHVAQLRAKLGPASPIRTVRGVGYAVDA